MSKKKVDVLKKTRDYVDHVVIVVISTRDLSDCGLFIDLDVMSESRRVSTRD